MKWTFIAKVEHIKTTHENGETTTRPLLTLECGHTTEPASHFSYRVGERWNCHKCEGDQNAA